MKQSSPMTRASGQTSKDYCWARPKEGRKRKRAEKQSCPNLYKKKMSSKP